MRVLVHICCGPCSITVLQGLAGAGHELRGFFFNPNIQPLAEYMRRREGAALVAERLNIPLLFADLLPQSDQIWSDPWLREKGRESSPPAIAAEASRSPALLPPAADPAPWLRAVAGRERERCGFCWRMRLRKTAETAKARGFEGFSASLLYSRHQDHEAIRATGESIAARTGLRFVYKDFRPTWQEGVRLSREWGIYRQQYCGCVFSEYDRYSRDFARLREEGEGAARP